MNKYISGALICGIIFFISACTSTFVASKDGKGYHMGSSSDAAYGMFCDSGDLKRILATTTFSQELKDNLFQNNCGSNRSREKVKQLFASMSPEQRKELRISFKNNGYEVNIMRC